MFTPPISRLQAYEAELIEASLAAIHESHRLLALARTIAMPIPPGFAVVGSLVPALPEDAAIIAACGSLVPAK